MLSAAITVGLLVAVVAVAVALLLNGADRARKLGAYGVTPEMRKQARTAEPDPGAPEPEEFGRC